jgi:hypothetical protein
MAMKPTLVIGDVHGHYDRLESLLLQEGILGELNGYHRRRVNFDVEVIQLGDLGHFGHSGSRTADQFCYEAVRDEKWCDYVLWGNHDRYVVDDYHSFGGCQKPGHATELAMRDLIREGVLRLAIARHGFLLTHAGLAKAFRHNSIPGLDKTDLDAVVEYLNHVAPGLPRTDRNRGIIDAISAYRGGRSSVGGILWRDINESLYPFNQVFGHSKRNKPKKYHIKGWGDKEGRIPTYTGYCVDVGTADNGYLAGIWLPSEKIVEYRSVPTVAGNRLYGTLPSGSEVDEGV